MVLLATLPGAFHAQVVAARLGADGVVTELRGAVGGPLPMTGEVQVWVPVADFELARDLFATGALAVDEDELEAAPLLRTRGFMVVAAVVVTLAWLVTRTVQLMIL
jgi:hypothetical protein